MSRSATLRFTSLAFATACALSPKAARAQASPAAEALFRSGREALDHGDYERACKQLRESDRIEPAVGTELNLATCEEKRGNIATAWQLYRAAVDKLPQADERAGI